MKLAQEQVSTIMQGYRLKLVVKNSFAVEHDFGTGNPVGEGFYVPGKSGMSHSNTSLP